MLSIHNTAAHIIVYKRDNIYKYIIDAYIGFHYLYRCQTFVLFIKKIAEPKCNKSLLGNYIQTEIDFHIGDFIVIYQFTVLQ